MKGSVNHIKKIQTNYLMSIGKKLLVSHIYEKSLIIYIYTNISITLSTISELLDQNPVIRHETNTKELLACGEIAF